MAQDPTLTTWVDSDRFVPRRFVRPALAFTDTEAASGIVLMVAAIVALIWANMPGGESYATFWDTHLAFSLGPIHLEETLREVINDGFMAIFFFVVGLEIKRELVSGELKDRRAAALPAIAALGGMVVPAAVYVLFVAGSEGVHGWGIPMATDIAFSVGVVALLGRRVPVGAKLFLLALAIADDIGAILVIATFYTSDLSFSYLAGGLVGLAIIYGANRAGVRAVSFYVSMAVVTWFFFLESGVHATLAGVAIGLLTPANPLIGSKQFDQLARRIIDTYPDDDGTEFSRDKVNEEALALAKLATESVSPLKRLEDSLHLWSSFAIVPVFALANAGIRFEGVSIGEAITHPVALGVAFGLVFGKTIGISAATWLAVKSGIGKLPSHTQWSHVVGVAMLAGIGFTVALFVAGLAFPEHAELADRAKVGIFAGSIVSGVLGYLVLRRTKPPESTTEQPTPENQPAKA